MTERIPMKCAQCQALIDDIGDMDRLPIDAARHVASCSPCERFGLELIGLRRLLREPARVAAPETFDVGLARRLRQAKAKPPSRTAVLWSFRPQTSLAVAAAFLFVCSGALVVSRYSASPESVSVPITTVATNRATDVQPARTGESPLISGVNAVAEAPGLPAVQVSANDGARTPRTTGRTRAVNHRGDSGDAMLLVSDERGSRLVNVPGVLIGSEMIVPVDSGDLGEASETVSF